MIAIRKYSLLSVLLILAIITGCASGKKNLPGSGTTATPGWARLKHASREAFRDPNVWGTLLSATVLQINNYDEDLSDRLREDTPLFGSAEVAGDASDDLRDSTELAYITTALLTPGPESTGDWFLSKAKLLGSEWLTVEMGRLATEEIKSATGRERPNSRDSESFTSGHVSAAATQAEMANINIEYLPINETSKQALGFTVDSFAALTGWARVEAGEHYPSDVLAGWAFSRFLSRISQEFIDPERDQYTIRPMTGPDTTGIEIIIKF